MVAMQPQLPARQGLVWHRKAVAIASVDEPAMIILANSVLAPWILLINKATPTARAKKQIEV
jgi:hypothetical protein